MNTQNTKKQLKQETLALHAGYAKDGEATLSVPIYQSTAYDFKSLERAANRFALKELGNIYTRLGNPTCDVLAKRLAALEGADAAQLISANVTASGTAAILGAILTLAGAGENILLSSKVYGGTATLCVHTLARFGIETRVFDIDDLDDLRAKIDDKSRAILYESLSNPQIHVADIEAISKIADEFGIVSICDNTVATPILCRPFCWGADLVVHSLSKYINGHANALGGAIIEAPKLNEKLVKNPRYALFNEPDPSYHGLVYKDLAPDFGIFSLRVKLEFLRNLGASASPANAYYQILGLETLALRMRSHSENAAALAEFLAAQGAVKAVFYPSINQKELSAKYLPQGASGLLSFELEGEEAAREFCAGVPIFAVCANIGDTKSLLIHPASTTHGQLSEAEKAKAGISAGLVRLSVGIESVEDLKNALGQGFKALSCQ